MLRTPATWIIALLLLAPWLAYYPALGNEFSYDDVQFKRERPFNQDIANARDLLHPATYTQSADYNYRPLWILSLMFDYALYGNNEQWHHITNLALHGLAAVAWFLLLLRLFDLHTAGVAAVLFALHPLHSEVMYITTFRPDIAVLLLSSIAVLAYLNACNALGAKRTLWLSASVLALAAACLFKESAVMATLAVPVIHAFQTDPRGKSLLRFHRHQIPLFLLAAAFLVLRFTVLKFDDIHTQHRLGRSMAASFGTTLVIFLQYLGLELFPLHLRVWAEYQVYHNPLEFMPLLALGLLLVLIMLALWKRRAWSAFSFGLFVFFLFLVPVSNVYPIVNPMAERYLYCPTAGFTLALAGLFVVLHKRIGAALWLLPLTVMVLYTIHDINRGADFRDQHTFMTAAARRSPRSPETLVYNARVAIALERYDLAAQHYRNYLADTGKHWKYIDTAHLDLGLCYVRMRQPQQAVDILKRGLEHSPDHPLLWTNLSAAYLYAGDHANAKLAAERVLELAPDFKIGQNNRTELAKNFSDNGRYYYKQREFAKAAAFLEMCLDLQPNQPHLQKMLGLSFHQTGRYDDAVKWLEEARKTLHRDEELERALQDAWRKRAAGG